MDVTRPATLNRARYSEYAHTRSCVEGCVCEGVFESCLTGGDASVEEGGDAIEDKLRGNGGK